MGIPLRGRLFLADQFRQSVQLIHRLDQRTPLMEIQQSGRRPILRHDRCVRKNRQILPAFADRIDPTSSAQVAGAASIDPVTPVFDESAMPQTTF